MKSDQEHPAVATSPDGDPWLFTPGPLTTSPTVNQAMLHDYGSRDSHFIGTNNQICRRLPQIVNGHKTHVCVPVQGSGTFAVEAMLITFIPRSGKALLLVNGAYGKRMAEICSIHERAYTILETAENLPVDTNELDRQLAADPGITHVAVVHCETTSGILNPIETIAKVTADHRRSLLIDAMSSFGVLPLDTSNTPFNAVVASSNKCLEGSPGMGFCICDSETLKKSSGNSDTLVLDLYSQWQAMERNGQWRFTPPTHTILALGQALTEFDAEGGVAGRGRRYRRNCETLVSGMRTLGFKTLLPDALQAPIIVTFLTPADPNFQFDEFYDELRKRGYIIYPGKLTISNSFRIGCIGHIFGDQVRGLLDAIRDTLGVMNVSNCGP
tara:strand:- start:6820 stop:7971 length:1152 start_codon:yes stop_codon:yes gene_type:complete